MDKKEFLKSLQIGDFVGVLEEVNGTFCIKEIVNISPRRIIELRGWKHKFRNGRNEQGWNIVSIKEYRRELIEKIETWQNKNSLAGLYRRFDALEAELRVRGIEDTDKFEEDMIRVK
jgi:hypothetical protein